FLLCTKRPVKPFIFQNRRKPQLVAKDDNSALRFLDR
ncbi:MAG: head protein, partial [Oscillibacter sp.]|nr:head protein [Oscillibacter sp.]